MESVVPLMESVNESVSALLRGESDAITAGLIIALMMVLITSVVFFGRFWRSGKERNAVLLLGLCDSGKTLLFSQLLLGKYVRTQTSITESSAIYRSKNERGSRWTLVDVPGHESLRDQVLEKYKAAARALVFVVDSSVFQKDVRDVAEFLYLLLTDAALARHAPALVVVCNKQDIATAKSARVIQQQLEREMNTLRVTRSAALSAQDGSAGTSLFLGRKGRDFDFSQLPNHVEFVEANARSAHADDAHIRSLETALDKL